MEFSFYILKKSLAINIIFIVFWGIFWCLKFYWEKKNKEQVEFIKVPVPKGKEKEFRKIINEFIKKNEKKKKKKFV